MRHTLQAAGGRTPPPRRIRASAPPRGGRARGRIRLRTAAQRVNRAYLHPPSTRPRRCRRGLLWCVPRAATRISPARRRLMGEPFRAGPLTHRAGPQSPAVGVLADLRARHSEARMRAEAQAIAQAAALAASAAEEQLNGQARPALRRCRPPAMFPSARQRDPSPHAAPLTAPALTGLHPRCALRGLCVSPPPPPKRTPSAPPLGRVHLPRRAAAGLDQRPGHAPRHRGGRRNAAG